MQRSDAGPMIRGVLLLALVLAAAACSPNRIPPGPGPIEPRLEPTKLIAHDGTILPLRHWRAGGKPPRAAVLALHGFNDYSNAFEGSAAWLAEQGFEVYAYDQRGFGETAHPGLWAGTEALVADLHTAVKLIRARHPDRGLFVLGESMGAAVAVVALTRPDAPAVDGVILSAPAVWARSTMPIHQRAALWLAERLMPGARFSGSGLKIQASDNIEMLRGLGRDPLVIKRTRVDAIGGLTDLMTAALEAGPRLEVPALVLYGEKDQIVPKSPTLDFWRSLPGLRDGRQRPALYAEGWHMLLRDLQAQTVLADLVHWMEGREGPLPSGADLGARAELGDNRENQSDATSRRDQISRFDANKSANWHNSLMR